MAAKLQEDGYQGGCLQAWLKFSGDPRNRMKRSPGEDGSRRVLAPQAGDMKIGHGNQKRRRSWYKLFQVRTYGRKTVPIDSQFVEETDGNELAEEGKLKKGAYIDRRVKAVPVPIAGVDQGRKANLGAWDARKTSPEKARKVVEISEQQAATPKVPWRGYSKDDPKSIRTRLSPENKKTSRKSESMLQNPIKGSRFIMGISIIFIASATLLLLGRPCAVICTSAWLYMVPRLTRLTKPIGCSHQRSRSRRRTDLWMIAIKDNIDRNF